MTTASVMSVLQPPGRIVQSNHNRPSEHPQGEWSGQRFDKTDDARAQMQDNVEYAKQEGDSGVANSRRTPGRSNSRGRQTSLRHVKNSKEVMRQRSANRGNQDIAPDNTAGGREGRQFTVANVGNHGRIYLRYVWLSCRRVM